MLFKTAAVVTLCFSALASPAHAQSFMDKLKNAAGAITAPSGSTSGSSATSLGTNEIIAGLREALRVGTENVVGQIGSADGFNADPNIHIPLPPDLQKVQGILRKFGLSGMADEVELKLNRAAEAAAPAAVELEACSNAVIH